MASPSAAADDTPKFPSFEALKALFDAANRTKKPAEEVDYQYYPKVRYVTCQVIPSRHYQSLHFPSPSLGRLRWSLDGPLETSVSVMAHSRISPGPPPDEPYYYQKSALPGCNGVVAGDDSGGSGIGSWHPISQDALVEPKVSSIIVNVGTLQDWEGYWIEAHEGHYHPSIMDLNPAQTRIGPLPGTDPDDPDGGWHYVTGLYADENGEDTWHLLRCCGVDRP